MRRGGNLSARGGEEGGREEGGAGKECGKPAENVGKSVLLCFCLHLGPTR